MVGIRKQNAFLFLVIFLFACTSAFAQARVAGLTSVRTSDSLVEIRDKRRALLVVFRSRVVDASGNERAIIDDVLRADPRPRGRFRRVYTMIGRKLDRYKHKYQSLFPAEGLADADYVIYFNVLEFRKILDRPYPYGELFVIVKGSPESAKPPRVVWRSNKALFAEDAIGNLLKELKAIRGEN